MEAFDLWCAAVGGTQLSAKLAIRQVVVLTWRGPAARSSQRSLTVIRATEDDGCHGAKARDLCRGAAATADPAGSRRDVLHRICPGKCSWLAAGCAGSNLLLAADATMGRQPHCNNNSSSPPWRIAAHCLCRHSLASLPAAFRSPSLEPTWWACPLSLGPCRPSHRRV